MGGVLDRARATSLIGRSLIREDAGVACCDGPDVIVCDARDTPSTSKCNLRMYFLGSGHSWSDLQCDGAVWRDGAAVKGKSSPCGSLVSRSLSRVTSAWQHIKPDERTEETAQTNAEVSFLCSPPPDLPGRSHCERIPMQPLAQST